MEISTKKWVASAFVTTMLLSVAFALGTAASEATVHYELAYEGPRDAEAVEPLLRAQLIRESDAGYGYGYGYGYEDAEAPSGDAGSGYGYGYGYGYGDEGFTLGVEPGTYRLLGFADLDANGSASEYEPTGEGALEDGRTAFHVGAGERVDLDVVVREAASLVTGRVVSTAGDAVANVRVNLTDAFGWTLTAHTDANGNFTVQDAPTGYAYDLPYSVSVEAEGYAPLATGLTHAVTRDAYDAGVLELTPLAGNTPATVTDFGPKGRVATATPTIHVGFTDDGPLDAVAVTLTVDGMALSVNRSAPDRAEANVTEALAPGHHRVEVLLRDADGAETRHAWTLVVAPGLTNCEDGQRAAERKMFRDLGYEGAYDEMTSWDPRVEDDWDRFYRDWCDLPSRAFGPSWSDEAWWRTVTDGWFRPWAWAMQAITP